METDLDELTLHDYLRVMRRRWRWGIVPAIAIPLLVILWSSSQPDRFSATARVLVATSAAEDTINGGGRNLGIENRELINEINLAQSEVVASQVEASVGFEPNMTIEAARDADVLEFTAIEATPAAAAGAANAWAEVYVAQKQSDALASLEQAASSLQQRLEDLRRDRAGVREPLDAAEDAAAAAADAVLVAQTIAASAGEPTALQLRDLAEAQAELARLESARDRIESDLSPELTVIDAQIRTVSESVADLGIQGELAGLGSARLIDVAAEPVGPFGSSPVRNGLIGVVLGALVAAGVMLLRDNLDDSITSPSDIEKSVGIPVLGAIAVAKGIDTTELSRATLTQPLSPVAEGYHRVRTALQFAMMGSSVRTVLVTSANMSEGKTTTSTNLAWAMTVGQKRTVLVDCDFRRPRVHSVYGLKLSPGVTDHFMSGTPIADLVAKVEHEGSALGIVSTGELPPNPGDFVASPLFVQLIDDLKQDSDLVIMDGPPTLAVSDSLTLSGYADGVVLTVLAGSTTQNQLEASVDALNKVGARIFGAVLIGVDGSSPYGYSGRYEYRSDTDSVRATRFNRSWTGDNASND